MSELKTKIRNALLLFAPMEGITDSSYRKFLGQYYPDWDYCFTSFLRCPSQGYYSEDKIIDHVGRSLFRDPILRKKNILQILTTARANTLDTIKSINSLGLEWVDLNVGCPSKTVTSRGGGSYLLSNLTDLKKVVSLIRKEYSGFFTVKMRTGFDSTDLFTETLRLLEGEGVDAITIHARTREQMYKGVADWDFIARAVSLCRIPVVGNGDIWDLSSIDQIYRKTGCHSVMMARTALKTPWMAKYYKHYHQNGITCDERSIRKKEIALYFENLSRELLNPGEGSPEFQIKKSNLNDGGKDQENQVLRRLKSLSRDIFSDFEDGEKIRSQFLRVTDLDQFLDLLKQL